MKFKNPALLILLFPVAIALVKAWWEMSGRKSSPRIIAPWKKVWAQRSGAIPIPPRFFHTVGYSVAAVLLILGLARPQTSYNKIKRNVEGIDIMVVLDLSASMRIEDFRDANRFEVAKQILKEFIAGRTSDKIGFEVFSGEAITMVPPTLDYTLVQEALKNSEIGDLKDGTAIGDALATAVGRLKESTAKSKVIVLLTDGDSNVGQVDPLTAGEMARGYGLKVYSVAIGRDGRVAMPFVQKDVFGRQVKTYQYFDSSINPSLLQTISNTTGGKFFRVQDDVNVLREVFKEIDQLERRKVETTEQVKYNEHFMWFVQMGLLCMLLTFMAQQTVLRVYP